MPEPVYEFCWSAEDFESLLADDLSIKNDDWMAIQDQAFDVWEFLASWSGSPVYIEEPAYA
jgi:hypothetical protein